MARDRQTFKSALGEEPLKRVRVSGVQGLLKTKEKFLQDVSDDVLTEEDRTRAFERLASAELRDLRLIMLHMYQMESMPIGGIIFLFNFLIG